MAAVIYGVSFSLWLLLSMVSVFLYGCFFYLWFYFFSMAAVFIYGFSFSIWLLFLSMVLVFL